MALGKQAGPAKEFNLAAESIKCLFFVALVTMAGYGFYVFKEPLLDFAGTTLKSALTAIFDTLATITVAAFDLLVSFHIYLQFAIFFLGLWMSCVGIKALKVGRKLDVAQKIEKVTFKLFCVQIGLLVTVDMYAYAGRDLSMILFFFAIMLIQSFGAARLDIDCGKMKNEIKNKRNVTENPETAPVVSS